MAQQLLTVEEEASLARYCLLVDDLGFSLTLRNGAGNCRGFIPTVPEKEWSLETIGSHGF